MDQSTISNLDVYQPRNVETSAYYKCVENHFEELIYSELSAFSLFLFLIPLLITIHFVNTIRAEPVTERYARMFFNIFFNPVPETFVIPDLFA